MRWVEIFWQMSTMTLVRFDMAEFGMVTQVRDKHISRGQPRPYFKGPGPQRPPNFWDPPNAQTV